MATKIKWDYYDPSRDAFLSGETRDQLIEVYRQSDPKDMRRNLYVVNIWERGDYTMGPPATSFCGSGGIEQGRKVAEKFCRTRK